LSLLPTALALYFLRPYGKFWTVLSWGSVAVAVSGPLAVAGMQLHQIGGGMAGLLGFERLIASPFLSVGFVIGAVIAPGGRPRRALFAAAVIEVTLIAYVFLSLFLLNRLC
jgi:hypothetical protein